MAEFTSSATSVCFAAWTTAVPCGGGAVAVHVAAGAPPPPVSSAARPPALRSIAPRAAGRRRAFAGACLRPRPSPVASSASSFSSFSPARMSILDFNVPEGAAAGIESLPLEPVPPAGAPLPAHWARPGVYGVYGEDGTLNYVAAVLNVADAVDTHRRHVPDAARLVHAVRLLTVENPEDAPLGTLAQNWLVSVAEDTPSGAPVGNTDEGSIWRIEEEKPRGGTIYFREGATEDVAELEIKRILRENKVVLFMKGTQDSPRCGFSNGVLSVLRSKLSLEDFACVDCLDSLRNVGLRDEIKRFSDWPTIPQLYINGEFVGGGDIVASLNETGELAELLEVAEVPLKAPKTRV